LDALDVGLEGEQTVAQHVFDRIEVDEDGVGKPVFAQDLPEVLGGAQLGTVGRQKYQTHIGRDLELASDVPAGLVHDHDDELIGVARGDCREEQRYGTEVLVVPPAATAQVDAGR